MARKKMKNGEKRRNDGQLSKKFSLDIKKLSLVGLKISSIG